MRMKILMLAMVKKLTANAVNEDPAGRERWISRKEI